MDLSDLRRFVAVAEERSITRAAARLHMTQPPLSTRLQSLERELGVPLLVRHKGGVELTSAGEVLASRARRLLADAEMLSEDVKAVGHGSLGRLVIAAGPLIAPAMLATLLRGMAQDAPDVTVELVELSGAIVPETVAQGDAHIGLIHLPPATVRPTANLGLESAVVSREPLIVVLPENHPAAASGERVDVAGLADDALIAPSNTANPGLHAHARQAWGSKQTHLREISSITAALTLVQARMGVAILPAGVRNSLPEGLVARPLVQHGVAAVETAVVWAPATDSPVLRRFLKLALYAPEPDVLGAGHARVDHFIEDK